MENTKPSEPSKPTKKPRTEAQKQALEKANKARAEKLKKWNEEKQKSLEEGKGYITWNKKAVEKKAKIQEDDAIIQTVLKALEQRELEKQQVVEKDNTIKSVYKPQRKNKTLKNNNSYHNRKATLPERKTVEYSDSEISERDSISDSDSETSEVIENGQELATAEDFKQLQQEIGDIFYKNKIVNELIKQQEAKSYTNSYTNSVNNQNTQNDPKLPNIIQSTKRIEPPRYTTDINVVYNPNTLQQPIHPPAPKQTQQQPQTRTLIYDTKVVPNRQPIQQQQPVINGNQFRESQLRQLMGLKQIERPRYEPQQTTTQYRTNSDLLNRVFFQ